MRKKLTVGIGGALIAAAALLMSIMGIRFLYDSPFRWTFMQPEYRNAVLEMMLMAWVYFGVLSVRRMKDRTRYSLVAILFLTQTFLRSYFWAVMANVLYFFTLGMTGYLICKKVLRHDDAEFELHKYILFGMSCEIILVALMSVFSVAYPATLRYVLLGICLIECVLLRKELLQSVRGFFHPQHELTETTHSVYENIAMAVCMTGITLIACRANQGLDFDSMWYEIQSEYALVPTGSIYHSPDLMSIVFTYAKGSEIVSLPFAGMTSYSFLTAINLVLTALTLLCVHSICSELKLKKAGMFVGSLLAMTPSVMALAMTAKSDTITLYLSMVAILYAIRVFCRRDSDAISFWIAFSALLLSYGMKQTSLLFSTIILICFVLIVLIKKTKIAVKQSVTLVIPLVALIVIILRTILISGLPFNNLIVSFLGKIGIEPKYPYYFPSVRVSALEELLSNLSFLWLRIARLSDIFFCPKDSALVTTMWTWWGPMISFVWLLSLLVPLSHPLNVIKRCQEEPAFFFLTVLHYSLSAFSIASMLLLEYPDGNYFVVAQAIACIYIVPAVQTLHLRLRSVAAWGFVPLLCVNFLIEGCISTSWSLGLTPINLRNMGYYNDYENRYNKALADNELDELYEYMQQDKFYAIISASNQDIVRFLPTAVDELSEFSAWGGRHLQDADAFYQYLSYAQIDGLLLDIKETTPSEFYSVLLDLANGGYLSSAFENNRYMLMRFSDVSHKVDDKVVFFLQKRLGIYDGMYSLPDCSPQSGIYEDHWVAADALIKVPGSHNGQIRLDIYIPFDLPDDACITVSVDGEQYKNFPVSSGSFTLEIQTEPYMEHLMGFTSNFEFNNPPDVRSLSFLITSLQSY